MKNKPPKPRRCPVCRELYTPVRINLKLSPCCFNPGCVLDYAQGVRAKAEKKANAKQKREFYKKDIKTRREAAIKYFNRYILLRDRDKSCVSCGNTNTLIKYDAGHYVPAGRCTALRFDERNVHKQCSQYCNVHRSGNMAPYAKAIVAMYGQEVLDFLDGPQPKIKVTAEFYQAIEDEYKDKIRQLEKELGDNYGI